MSTKQQPDRMRRVVSDLIMAEMFLVQATIESATAIGDGISALSRQLDDDSDADTVARVLARTADEAIEPYSSRIKVLRDILEREPAGQPALEHKSAA
jgi:hypothetical protein